MSLEIQHNPDGTITVSCNGESVTIGAPTSTGASGGIGSFPPITLSSGSTIASIFADRPFLTEYGMANTVNEIVTRINSEKASLGGDPVRLNFRWSGMDPIDISPISQALSKIDENAILQVRIQFSSDSDE